MTDLTKERLRELLAYDATTGVFTWLVGRGPNARPGAVAGKLDSYGYRQIMIDGSAYLAHRLVWLYTYGCWPRAQIDHRNGVRDDNCMANLRDAEISENQQNVAKRAGSSSRLLGVTWHRHAKKWQAKIQHKRVKIHIGYFDTEEAAHAAYLTAKAELHAFNPALRDASNGPTA